MKTDINLASGILVESASKSKTLKILRITAVSSIALTAVMGVLLFFLINQISPDKIKKQEDKILVNIKFLRERKAKVFTINSRIADISKILASRTNYDLEMNAFLEKIPSGVLINSFEIGKDKILITASSNSLTAMDNMLNNLIEMIAKKQIIKSMTIQSFSSDPRNSTFNLSIKTNKL